MKISADIVRNVTIDAHAIDAQNVSGICVEEMSNTLKRLRDVIARGVGANGNKIKPSGYSESYKQQIRRAKQSYAARTTKRDGTKRSRPLPIKGSNKLENKLAQKDENTPNLFVTGDLLGSMQSEAIQNGARGYFNDQTQVVKASVLMERGFEGWFEFGAVDLTRINDRFDKILADVAETIVKQT